MKEFIKNHFDFGFNIAVIPALICLLLSVPCILYLPERYGYENGIIENLQMIVLIVSFFLCLKAKNNKKFFVFIALIILLMALREVNYGRTIFFPVPDRVNMYYSWKDIKYGYLVHPAVVVYIMCIFVYFFKNKLYLPLRNLITKVKIPVLNFCMLITGFISGIYAEKTSGTLVMMQDLSTGLIFEKMTENLVWEEMSELLLYLALAGIIYLYAYKKQETN